MHMCKCAWTRRSMLPPTISPVLAAAITEAVQTGNVSVTYATDHAFLGWPSVDGRFTIVTYNHSDPDYPETKANEIRSYCGLVETVLNFGDINADDEQGDTDGVDEEQRDQS
jgi:hypothetical protein